MRLHILSLAQYKVNALLLVRPSKTDENTPPEDALRKPVRRHGGRYQQGGCVWLPLTVFCPREFRVKVPQAESSACDLPATAVADIA